MAHRFEDLGAEYADRWQRMTIRPERLAEVNAIASRLIGSKARYQQVESATRVPWFIIAMLHQREASANFAGVLHNGERIIGTGKITHLVPRGRGPFSSWEESAIDALTMAPHSLHLVSKWTIERACFEIEKYNGFGYRNRGMNSPYLWSFSNNYARGKFVSDGHFDPAAVDKQCGTMPILKQMMGLDSLVRLDGGAIVPVSHSTVEPVLGMGLKGEAVRQLQAALVSQGFQVGEIDGDFGPNTAAAVKAFQIACRLPATGLADQATLQVLATGQKAPARDTLESRDILLALISALKAQAPGHDGPPLEGAPEGPANVLRLLLGALMGRQSVSVPDGAVVTAPVLSPIDRVLGGEALAGKKTALAVVAYAVLAILKTVGVVGAATPAGQIATVLITAFGALGGVSKIDRVIQTLGIMAAKPK
ncbi:peptidoglycan-binding protein [Microvirga massiliensis]|uniref:peptidoglycan-binding protein n=1 Tax=Microvirga massiliensis TaxID=1033741 RepID=UPI00062B5974|nr:peptidoglycan-binding protein [Microvirga massiliensis]